MTTNGELKDIKRIEWNISDFFTLAKSGNDIYSPKFFIRDSYESLYFLICPRWKDTDKFMGIYLMRDRALEYKVECSFDLRKSDCSVVHLGNEILEKFIRFNDRNDFIKKKELLDQKSELVPGNTLTIICTIKFETEIADSIQKPVLKETMLSKLSNLDKLSENLKSMFSDKESCDVTLKVKDKEYKAHKFILTARSSVFAANFKHDTLEKQTGIITISDCDPDSFQAFLEYLYCGTLEQISSSSALSLYYTSDKYDVGELKEFCIQYLMQNLTVENICEVAAFADKYDQTQLFSAVQDFYNKNAYEISETSGWECLMQKDYRLANKLLKEVLKGKK